jgi:hypothetical protein
MIGTGQQKGKSKAGSAQGEQKAVLEGNGQAGKDWGLER